MKISVGRISSFINGIKFANKLSYLRNRVEKHFATEDESLYSIDVAIVYTKKFTVWSNGNEYVIAKDVDVSKRVKQLILWDKLKSTNYIVDILGTYIDDDFSLDILANLIGCSKNWILIDKPKNVRIV